MNFACASKKCRVMFTKTWRQTNYWTGWKTLCEEGCKCICMASSSANVCEHWWARKVRDKFCWRRRSQSLVGRHYKVLTLQILVRPRAYSTGRSFSPLFVC